MDDQSTYTLQSLREGGGSQPRYAPLLKQYSNRALKHGSCGEKKQESKTICHKLVGYGININKKKHIS